MDPLTAFSLACGVIQVVDFSTKVAIKCKEIYHDGVLHDYDDLENLSNHLTDLQTGLQLPSEITINANTQSPDEKSLLRVAEDCSMTAQQLVTKLHALRIEGPNKKKRQAVRKTLGAFWAKRDIQDIQKQLNSYRNALDTQILQQNFLSGFPSSAWSHSQGVAPRDRGMASHFKGNYYGMPLDLDEKVQRLIAGVSRGSKNFEDLKILIQDEHESTRGHISSEMHQHERRLAQADYRKRLLGSLWYSEIHSREEIIKDAHKETFEWIFDKSGKAIYPWQNFVQWLESGQKTYWINGKAGSGKSTLMNFLCQDDRTAQALNVWSGSRDILIIKFFFWSSGSIMQKSVEGLLRSLLWQILQVFPDLSAVPGEVDIPLDSKKGHSQYLTPIAAWKERRLRRMLRSVVQQVQISCCLCIFIDGLDEFDGDQEELLNFIEETIESPDCKICLSSRPYRVFEQSFGSSAALRLQDMTQGDISKYVSDKLESVAHVECFMSNNSDWLMKAVDTITNRAEGVFLWVSLAVKDQIRGIKEDDSPEQLWQRLCCLPSEVEGIYARMLDQIAKRHQREAALLLQVALSQRETSLLDLVLASRERLDELLMSDGRISELELITKSLFVRKRLVTICAGLLEVHERNRMKNRDLICDSAIKDRAGFFRGEATREEIFDLEWNFGIHFIHRTARDFVQERVQGKMFPDASTPNFDFNVLHVHVALAKARLFGFRSETWYIRHIMYWTSKAENNTGTAPVGLFDLIDSTMSKIDQSHPDHRPNFHWCTRWGPFSARFYRHSTDSELELNPDKEASFHSSSSESFHSADSRPMTKSDWTSLRSKADFMTTLAASYGLLRYAKHMLDRQTFTSNDERLNCMLEVSVPRIEDDPVDVLALLSLTEYLLRRGGNPNVYIPSLGYTAWGYHLLTLYHRTRDAYFRGQLKFTEINQGLVTNTTVCIESGADLQSTITIDLHDHQLEDHQCLFNANVAGSTIIESCLKVLPQMSHTRDLYIAKGGLQHSRYPGFSMRHFKADGVRDVELSAQESAICLEVFMNYANFKPLNPQLLTLISVVFARMEASGLDPSQ